MMMEMMKIIIHETNSESSENIEANEKKKKISTKKTIIDNI